MQVEVYIATTQGLVNIQSIHPIYDDDISPVITINHTSQLAGISSSYNAFVNTATGIIEQEFDGKSFRVNISSNIQQGQSWNLGFYIAHYLHATSQLFTQSSLQPLSDKSAQSDLVIIATGCINTTTKTVTQVGDLAKKCLTANPQIQTWLSQNKKVCFLAPVANLRQPIPDTSVQLTPVFELKEMHSLFNVLGLNTLLELKNVSKDGANEVNALKSTHTHINSSSVKEDDWQDIEYINIDNRSLKTRRIIIGIVALVVIVVSLFITFRNYNDEPITSTAVGLLVKANQNNTCNDVELKLHAKAFWTNTSISNMTKRFAPLNIDSLCELALVSSNNINAIYLLTDSKAFLKLNKIALGESTINIINVNLEQHDMPAITETHRHASSVWHIPLPSNKQLARSYFIIALGSDIDLADKQSIEAQLFSYYQEAQNLKSQDIEILLKKLKIKQPFYILSHQLLK